MPTYRIAFFCLTIALSTLGYAKSTTESDFELTYSQLKAGKKPDYSAFKSHILYPYLEYEYLTQDTSSLPTSTMVRFIQQYADSPLSDKLRTQLVKRYNNDKQWEKTFLEYQSEPSGLKARCLHLEARIALGDKERALPAAKKLWMSGRDRPSECDPLFGKLKKFKQLSDNDYWERIGLAIDKGATSLAKSLSKQLNRKGKKLTKTLEVCLLRFLSSRA